MNRQPMAPITDADVAAYRRDGAVYLRAMFDQDWLALLAKGVERNIAEPGRYAHLPHRCEPATNSTEISRATGSSGSQIEQTCSPSTTQ